MFLLQIARFKNNEFSTHPQTAFATSQALTIQMKKVMSRLSNHYYCCASKHVIRLLALLLVVAVATPVLLAEDGEHDNVRDHGRFVDPIVGSWLVHATIDTPPPTVKFDAVLAIFEDGIVVTTVAGGAPAVGVWKRSGPPRTYDLKFLFPSGPGYPPGAIGTGLPYNLVLNPQGTQLTSPFRGFDTAPNGMVIDQFSGTGVIDRISFTSNP